MPILTGNGIVLRPYLDEDAEPLAAGLNNRNVWRNLGHGVPHPYTVDMARDWIAQSRALSTGELRFTIAVEGIASGGIDLRPVRAWSPHTFELGYWLAEPYWRRGIVTQAVALLTAYGFDEACAERLQAFVFDWNDGSRRVLEKNGYTLEGRLRRAVHKDGRTADLLVYARLR